MRISMERFAKEVSGQAGTLCAVLAEGATFFVFDAITARLCKKNITLTSADGSFSLPRKESHKISKMICKEELSVEYEILTIHGNSIIVDVA
ncbi:MAG: hypothetical protein ACLRRS_01275 [Faecalibacterium prausnitzii]